MSMLSRFATLGGLPGDPYWSNVSFLLVGNGANGTTTNIKDSSSNNLTVTNKGSVIISTAVNPPAITNSSTGTVNFNGDVNSKLSTSSSNYAFGTNDFTVDGWVYLSAVASYQTIFSTRNSSDSNIANSVFIGFDTGTSKLMLYTNALIASTSMSATLNSWVFISVVRSSGTLKLYLNGVSYASVSFTVNLTGTDGTLGRTAINDHPFIGYLYDLRVTKNIARYTADYTPPPFPPTAAMPTY